MTRRVIWAKDDYFEQKNKVEDGAEQTYFKIYMDPSVVVLPAAGESIPISVGFRSDELPVGNITDIRLNDGIIDGEVFWFADQKEHLEALIESGECVFGGFYGDVVQTTGEGVKKRVLSCTLRGASVVPASEIRARPQPTV